MLVHSCIYYKYNENIVSDNTWSRWAKELEKLQDDNPKLSNEIDWAEEFKNWDGSSGAFLPLDDEWVDRTARKLLGLNKQVEHPKPKKQTAPKPKQTKTKSMRLF
jgi:hypothetical protein